MTTKQIVFNARQQARREGFGKNVILRNVYIAGYLAGYSYRLELDVKATDRKIARLDKLTIKPTVHKRK